MKILPVALLAAALAGSPALAATYVTDTATYSGLGDQLGTMYDQIVLNGVTGTATGSGTYLVNTVDFIVGLNSNTGGVYSGTFTNTATVDGTPYSYSLPYTITIGTTDTIVIGGNTVNYGGVKVTFNTLTFTNVGIGTVSGNLTATVSVPEPATWSLMIIGFGAIGYAMRHRQKVTVSYA